MRKPRPGAGRALYSPSLVGPARPCRSVKPLRLRRRPCAVISARPHTRPRPLCVDRQKITSSRPTLCAGRPGRPHKQERKARPACYPFELLRQTRSKTPVTQIPAPGEKKSARVGSLVSKPGWPAAQEQESPAKKRRAALYLVCQRSRNHAQTQPGPGQAAGNNLVAPRAPAAIQENNPPRSGGQVVRQAGAVHAQEKAPACFRPGPYTHTSYYGIGRSSKKPSFSTSAEETVCPCFNRAHIRAACPCSRARASSARSCSRSCPARSKIAGNVTARRSR